MAIIWFVILGWLLLPAIAAPIVGAALCRKRRRYYPRAYVDVTPSTCKCGHPRFLCKAGDC